MIHLLSKEEFVNVCKSIDFAGHSGIDINATVFYERYKNGNFKSDKLVLGIWLRIAEEEKMIRLLQEAIDA